MQRGAVDQAGKGGGDGVGEDGGLLERQLVGNGRQRAEGHGDVLRPGAIVEGAHDLELEALVGAAADAVAALPAGPATGHDDAMAGPPARHARPDRLDDARGLVARGDLGQGGRQ